MITILFLINIILLILIISRYTFFSAETICFLLFFIYGFSFYIDNIVFDTNTLSVYNLGSIDIKSNNYLIITILYTLFSIFYCLGLYTYKKPYNEKTDVKIFYDDKTLKYRLTLLLFSFVYIYIIYNLLSLSRSEKLLFFASNKLLNTIAAIGLFTFIIVGLKCVLINKKANFTELVFLIITLLYGLIEGGREIFIYVILILIPYFKTLKNKLVLFLFFPVFLFLITTWKAISIFVFQIGDVEQFSEWFSADLSFTFSGLDPIVSVLLLNNYLDGINIFDNFYFSYIINTFSQFFAAINIYEYQSISKQIVKYFDPTAYSDGKGFAFSGILESLLNFWYFGPMFLGLICGGILSKIRRFKTDTILSNILAIFFIIIILKLIRTELAVVLKIYLLPMILSYIIIFKKFKIA